MGVFTVGRQVAIEILMPGWWLSGASLDLDFRNARYYDSSVPNTVPVVTSYLSCTRASTGYAKDSSGTWVSFASNQLRITDRGLLIEDARTNNLINSATPATQTTASLATGDYTLWVEGSGSALASAGSATITGAASTTENNPDTFTVTVAGTVTVTVTGSLTKFQLELGSFPSSFILTTGTAATRAADAVTCISNLSTLLTATAASALGDVTWNAPDGSYNYWRIIGDSSVNRLLMGNSSGNAALADSYNGSAFLPASLGSGLFTTGAKVASAFNASGRSIVGNGGTVSSDANTFTFTTPTVGNSTGVYTFGYFRRLTFWNTKLADATLQALTAP